MDPTSGPSTPRPSLKRPRAYRKTSEVLLPVASPPLRRESEPALDWRRPSNESDTFAARRKKMPPLPRPSLRGRAPHSDRSVTFSVTSPFRMEMAPFHSQPGTPTYPLLHTPEPHEVTLFGVRTQFRPLWLLALGNAGLTGIGLGSVLCQRAIWPVKAYEGINPDGPTLLPGGEPGHGRAFGSPQKDIIAGAIFMGAGLGAAVASSILFMQDGRRLNRAQNPASPAYRRTMSYFSAHIAGLAILVGHRFFQEAMRSALPPQAAWVISLPGGFATAVYAVTIAQSFSSSELACGTMPIRNRAVLSAVARGMVSSYIILGAILSTPNFSAYGREAVRLVTAVSTTVAYSLPLATARMAGPTADIPVGGQRYRGDWSAMQAFIVYCAARLSGSISAFWLARARWPADKQGIRPPHGADGAPPLTSQLFRGLPPPLPSLPPDYDETAAAALLMAMSFAGCCYAFSQFHRDARPPEWLARLVLGSMISSVLFGQTFRVLQELAKSHGSFAFSWVAVVPGVIAHALIFTAIPVAFANSEAGYGNSIIRHRYQVIEACRFIGGISWYLWAAENQDLGFPPVARQLTVWLATSATLLGFSLPTTDTLRAATGPTPQREIPNPFD